MTEPNEPAILRAAMRELPPELGKLLEAYYFARASIEELSRLAGVSVSAVRARLTRGRAALQTILKDDPRWVALSKAREHELRAEQREARRLVLARLRRAGSDGSGGAKAGTSGGGSTAELRPPSPRKRTKN